MPHASVPRCVVRRSGIHGLGLFATDTIAPGEPIGTYLGPRTREDGPYVLWISLDVDAFGIDGRNELRYVNHSPRPNAEFVEHELFAIRRIAAGEEITHHYGDAWE